MKRGREYGVTPVCGCEIFFKSRLSKHRVIKSLKRINLISKTFKSKRLTVIYTINKKTPEQTPVNSGRYSVNTPWR